MSRRPDEPMDPEAQALDAYADWIARNPGSPPPPPADEVQAFAARIHQMVPEMTPDALANDPILAKLRSSQQEYLSEQARILHEQAASERVRRTTVETERASLWAGETQTGAASPQQPGSRGSGPAAAARRMPGFSYRTAFALLCLVTLTLFAITLSSGDRFRNTGGNIAGDPGDLSTPGISSLIPSVVIEGVEMQIVDWDVREVVGNGDDRETPFRGAFVVIELVLVKAEGDPAPVPFHGLLVQDDQGNLFTIDLPATDANQAIEGGISVANGDLVGSTPQIALLTFDVPVNSTSYQLTDIEQTFSLPLVDQ